MAKAFSGIAGISKDVEGSLGRRAPQILNSPGHLLNRVPRIHGLPNSDKPPSIRTTGAEIITNIILRSI